MGGAKKRVAILGGGVSGMAAAFGITAAPNWQDDYEITVYQLGLAAGRQGRCWAQRPGQERRELSTGRCWRTLQAVPARSGLILSTGART